MKPGPRLPGHSPRPSRVERYAKGRANKTLRNIEGAWVRDTNVMIQDGSITGYKVNLEVTFVLEDTV